MGRFLTKRQQSQRNRWIKVKQAQEQANKKEDPILEEALQECNTEAESTEDPPQVQQQGCNTKQEFAEEPPPEEHPVIKTESVEIIDVPLPPDEPTETHPIPENPFCCLCLRIYPESHFVQFSPPQTLDCLDVVEVQTVLTKVLGLEIDIGAHRAFCRSCWAVTELLADFRACCWMAAEWRERFSVGIKTRETSREGWIIRAGMDVVEKMRTTVLNHVERIEQARIERETEQMLEPDEDSFQDDLESMVDDLESTKDDGKSKIVEQSVEMVEEIKEINVHSCTKCGQKFEGKNNMIVHLYYCNKTAPNKQRKLHTCTICTADFNTPKELQDHLNKHKGIKPYKCRRGKCNHHSYTVKERIRHEGRCGKDKPICPECGLQTATRDSLKAHMETHGEATHPCDICGKLFKSKSTRKKHRLVHSEDRDFPCSVCKKSLKSADALRVHMRIHTQEKPHPCHLCGQRFAYKCLVKPHIKKWHSGGDCA